MATSDDRRGAAVLLVVAALGIGVRFVTGGAGAPGAVGYRAPPAAPGVRDSVAAEARRLTRPLAPGERVDVDRSSAAQLVRLPRIGPGLAGRIVADREEFGPFGSAEGLGRVPGIGAGTLAQLEPHIRFSGRRRRGRPQAEGGQVRVNVAGVEELVTLPGIGPVLAAAIVAERRSGGPFQTAAALTRVRGIGTRTVERIRGRIIVP